jgi:hypothetical protein
LWSIDQFKNRLDLAKDMLEKYVQDPKNPVVIIILFSCLINKEIHFGIHVKPNLSDKPI